MSVAARVFREDIRSLLLMTIPGQPDAIRIIARLGKISAVIWLLMVLCVSVLPRRWKVAI